MQMHSRKNQWKGPFRICHSVNSCTHRRTLDRCTILSCLRHSLVPRLFSTTGISFRTTTSHSDHLLLRSAVADDVPALAKIALRLRPSDARQYRSWALASHAGAYTLVHHDSAGMSTYVVGASGVKYWFYVQWITEPTPTSHAFRLQAASDHNIMSIEYSSQPPWVVYDEDNQEFSFVESIHEAEESRRWEKEHPKVSQVYMIPLRPGMCM